ncbi:SpoIIE family protein phosphatase [Candidatus Parabeggiatoa sp. HSG14]|uniref:PP2C family protein-serine/threonine phosphatase n=1 Tax=Candidatus Parabeggiatoa sp. HSG14 TaxID=3055593 RepID=UPI0032E52F0D
MFKNISLTLKIFVFTLLIGTVVWIILDYIQGKDIQQLLFAELTEELEIHAKEDRTIFDRYIQSHNQATKLIISQQRFQTYVSNSKLDNQGIKHHYRLPSWLPTSSVVRTFFFARFAILIDNDGIVREIYHHFPEELPQTLKKPSALLQKLSHNQSYMTTIEEMPYIISSRHFKDNEGQTVATLMLASPIDDEFLIDANGSFSRDGVVVTLLDGEASRIIASSDPDLLPTNTLVETLEKIYIKTGASFFDYGASDIDAQFASFMRIERAYHLSNKIIKKSYEQRAFFAVVLILSFVLLTVWIAQRIKSVTKQVVVFSRESLGLNIQYSGDEVARIVTSFQQLRDSIKGTIERATAIAMGNYNYQAEHYSEQDQLGRALTDMNHTLQSQTQELLNHQEELRQTNDALNDLNNKLEQRVIERTGQLAKANQEITELNERLKAENIRMGAELDITRRLQQMVLPSKKELDDIEELDIAGFMEPAEEVGGDYYDVLEQDEHIKIGIGDVTGHGLESGVLMLMVQTAVRTLLTSHINNPEDFLSILNRTIYNNIQRMNTDKNLTLSLLDYHKGVLNLTGQHEEVLVVRKNAHVERISTVHLGFMVGVIPNIAHVVSHLEIKLHQGDGIVLYTDGITEARNLKNKFYGIERLCEIISHQWHLSALEIKQMIIDDVRQHIGEQKVFDDITLLILKQK